MTNTVEFHARDLRDLYLEFCTLGSWIATPILHESVSTWVSEPGFLSALNELSELEGVRVETIAGTPWLRIDV